MSKFKMKRTVMKTVQKAPDLALVGSMTISASLSLALTFFPALSLSLVFLSTTYLSTFFLSYLHTSHFFHSFARLFSLHIEAKFVPSSCISNEVLSSRKPNVLLLVDHNERTSLVRTKFIL